MFVSHSERPQCQAVTAPNNGQMTGDGFDSDDQRQFTCNSGYRLVGSATITCQSNGNGGLVWSSGPPTCQGTLNESIKMYK